MIIFISFEDFVYRFRFVKPFIKVLPKWIIDSIKSRIIFKIEEETSSGSDKGDVSNRIDLEKNRVWKNIDIALGFIDAEKSPQARLMNNNVNQIMREGLNHQEYILDMGCGYGGLTAELLKTNAKIFAIDSSEILLKHLKRRLIRKQNISLDKLHIVEGDAFKMPFKDETFDAVVSRMFVYHFSNWKSLIKESKRVVKKNGLIKHHMPIKDNYDFWLQANLINVDQIEYKNDILSYNACVSLNELREFAEENFISIISVEPTQFFHYNNVMRLKKDGIRLQVPDKLLKNKEVQSFISWFDNNVSKNMPVGSSLWNIVTFQRVD